MFKALPIICITLTGCAFPATYTRPMNNPYVVASQTSELTQGIIGPNNVSSGINEGLNYYRNGLAVLQNPWNLQAYIR